MKTLLRWLVVAFAAAIALSCQVDRLLRYGNGHPPPADSAAAKVTFSTQPNNATVGQAISPPVSVVITDSAGNPVPSYSGSVTVGLGTNASGATLSGANTATAANGVAMFPGLSLNKAGTGYTLTAAASGLSGATSAPFDVSTVPAPRATHLIFTRQPSSAQAGATISPAVQVSVADSTGSTVLGYNGSVTVALGTNPGGGALSGTRVIPVNQGVATFADLTIDKPGTGYSLVASASGLTGATSDPFDVTAVPPPPPMATTLKFTAQPQSAETGASLGTITVAAVDSAGATVTDFSGTVTLAIGTNPSGGTLSGTASASLASGVATFSGLSIDKAGSNYTLTASTNGLGSATSSAFNVTAPPPTTGSVTVSVATTGSNLDPDGYTVSVDGGSNTQAVTDNGTVTFANLPAGSHTVGLSGLASNCLASGGTSQTVSVPAGGTASASFAVTCTAPPPTTGSLTVSTTTTGSNLDPDGYTATVDGGASQAIGDNASVTFANLSAGSHTVVLSGLSSNCSVGNASQTVTVPSGGSASASYAVSCVAPPPTTGSLTVTTATGGSNLDPDGYTATVDGSNGQSVGINSSVTFTNLSSGSHTVVLSGVASNCSVSGGTSQAVNVPAGGTGSASFSVSCAAPPPTTGSLNVSTTTTGSNLDPDGYTATVDGGASQPIGDNASVTFSNLSAGGHTVVLSGLASNCSVGSASQTVNVPAGGSASAAYAVSCQAPPPPTTGSLTVTTSTSGSNLDPDGYSVSVDGGSSQAISDNGNVTFSNLTSGSHTVSLSGLASNCSAGSTSQTVTVPAGGSTSASFAVTCQASPPPTNHPPVVNAGGNQSQLVSVLYQLNASFTDPDGAGDGPWTYSVNWGDGTSSTGTLSAQGAIGPGHTYVLPGAYTITVTVTDVHGASGTDSKTLTVTL